MGYVVRRWDNWSSAEGLTGLAGLEAMLNAERRQGRRLVQLVVASEDIYLVVLEEEEGTTGRSPA
ncbi:MAG TPA: hypothetical protein VKU92_07445 [Acidimicrobiales bacterium]|nr:hypothetical protein [Acidimicrobiales bacterium]